MDLRKYETSLIVACSALFFIIIALASCSYLNEKIGLPNDNPIEEALEDISREVAEGAIRSATGIDVELPEIDFTPEDSEN